MGRPFFYYYGVRLYFHNIFITDLEIWLRPTPHKLNVNTFSRLDVLLGYQYQAWIVILGGHEDLGLAVWVPPGVIYQAAEATLVLRGVDAPLPPPSVEAVDVAPIARWVCVVFGISLPGLLEVNQVACVLDLKTKEEFSLVQGRYELRCLEEGKVKVPDKGKKNCTGFGYIGPRMWNHLPGHIRKTTIRGIFKKKSKIGYGNKSQMCDIPRPRALM